MLARRHCRLSAQEIKCQLWVDAHCLGWPSAPPSAATHIAPNSTQAEVIETLDKAANVVLAESAEYPLRRTRRYPAGWRMRPTNGGRWRSFRGRKWIRRDSAAAGAPSVLSAPLEHPGCSSYLLLKTARVREDQYRLIAFVVKIVINQLSISYLNRSISERSR
jgi:hypothetical protein